jgi:hypothetical protein
MMQDGVAAYLYLDTEFRQILTLSAEMVDVVEELSRG